MNTLLGRIASFFLFISTAQAVTPAASTGDVLKILQKIKTDHKTGVLNDSIQLLKEGVRPEKTENQTPVFNEEELFILTEDAIKSLRRYDNITNTEEFTHLTAIFRSLTKQLKDYKISGVGFAHHADLALFYSRQNFNVPFIFKDANGTAHQRLFNLKYSSLGLQESISWRFDAIFAVDTDLSRYSTMAPLSFSTGLTASWHLPIGPRFELNLHQMGIAAPRQHGRITPAVIGLTILPFQGELGSLVIAHLALGLNRGVMGEGLLPFDSFRGAIIFPKGSLTPLDIALEADQD